MSQIGLLPSLLRRRFTTPTVTTMATTDELVRAVLDGDQAAFADLVRRYERAVWATAWKVLRDYHATQDATQDAFVEAYCRLGQLRRADLFGVWLLRIARNEALRHARQRWKSAALVAADNIATPESLTPDMADLVDAVGRLPDQERLVVALRYLEGLPVADIARHTARPIGTVTKQLSRALERLRSFNRELKP